MPDANRPDLYGTQQVIPLHLRVFLQQQQKMHETCDDAAQTCTGDIDGLGRKTLHEDVDPLVRQYLFQGSGFHKKVSDGAEKLKQILGSQAVQLQEGTA